MPLKISLLTIFSCLFLVSAVRIEEASYKLAKKLYDQQRYSEAASEFDTIIRNYPESSYYTIALYYGGLCQQSTGDYNRAQALFTRLYQISKNPAQKELAYYGIAKTYYLQKKYANTINSFQNFLSAYPNSSKADSAFFLMAQAYAQRGENDKAKLYYQQVVSYFPHSPFAPYASSRLQDNVSIAPKKDTQTTKSTEWDQIQEPQIDLDLQEVEEEVKPVKVEVIQESPEEKEIQITEEKPQKKLPSITGRVEGLLLSQKQTLDIPQQQVSIQTQAVNPVENKIVILTNMQKIISTNMINITNMTMLTQKVKVLDTEQLKIDNKKSQIQLQQEEIDRLRRLLEIKARLLDLKEDAIKQKTELLQKTNGVVLLDE